jgi:hypothetical protein
MSWHRDHLEFASNGCFFLRWQTEIAIQVYEWLQDTNDRWAETGMNCISNKLSNRLIFLKELRGMADLQSILLRKSLINSVPSEWGSGFVDQSLEYSIDLSNVAENQRLVLKALALYSPRKLRKIESKIYSMRLTGQNSKEVGVFGMAM